MTGTSEGIDGIFPLFFGIFKANPRT